MIEPVAGGIEIFQDQELVVVPVLIMNLKSMLSIFQNIHQAVPGSTNTSKKHMVLVRLASLPILWALFQGYHMICKFLALYVMILIPQRFETYTTPYYFGIAMVNLLVWSTLAALWPRWGVGDAWHPHRGQSMVVLSIVALCLILIPLTHTLVPAPSFTPPVRMKLRSSGWGLLPGP